MNKGLTVLSSLQPIKYLKSVSLSLNLSDTNIWFVFTRFKTIGYLETWTFLQRYQYFNSSLSFLLHTKKVHILFFAAWYFPWYSFTLHFLSCFFGIYFFSFCFFFFFWQISIFIFCFFYNIICNIIFRSFFFTITIMISIFAFCNNYCLLNQ